MEIIPLRKRLTVNINGEIFKTQKSLIEKVKPLLDEAEIIKPDNQRFILEFVKSYDKVLYKNKSLQRVYFGPNKDVPTYFKNSKCLHIVFVDASEITVSYKNVVAALFDPEIAYQRRQRENLLQ